MEPGQILFRKKPHILDTSGYLENVTIYTNGIKAWFHFTDKNGKMPSVTYYKTGGELKFVPKEDIVKIYRYKYFLYKEPKKPTGFHLETKDNEICLIKRGLYGKYYNEILNALKKCFGIRWDEIFDKKILIDLESMKIQR